MTAKSSAKRYSLSRFKLYFTLDHLQYGHRVFINIDHRTRELNFVFRNHGNLSPKRNFELNLNILSWREGGGGGEQPLWGREELHPDVPSLKPLDHHDTTL